jgi:hypothetical protein
LVVILIMLIVAGVSIPVIAPSLDSRRLRETSRAITAYLQGARDTAMRNGRPVGVMFERYVDRTSGAAMPGMSIVLRQVEVPPPYAGDTLLSRIDVVYVPPNLEIRNFKNGDIGWMNLIRIGDLVRLNFQGSMYLISSGPFDPNDPQRYLNQPPSTTPWRCTPLGNVPPNLALGAEVPFQIFRQPVRSSNPPLQLPESLVIDLQYSGMGTGTDFKPLNDSLPVNDLLPVMVMFSPSGTVERIYGSQLSGGNVVPYSSPATATLHFLLGKRERVNNDRADITPEGLANFRDLENFWISIHPQSGLITATEVAQINTPDPTDFLSQLSQSRLYAEHGQAIGGR